MKTENRQKLIKNIYKHFNSVELNFGCTKKFTKNMHPSICLIIVDT